MIQVSLHDSNDNTIFPSIWFKEMPHKGDYIWITGQYRKSFLVEKTCHWVSPGYSPSTHNGDPIHFGCLYVKELK